MPQRLLTAAFRTLGALALASATTACSDSNDAKEASDPLYAAMIEVYDDTGSISYLSLLDSLDVEEVDLSQARELGSGRAFVQAYGGWLFIGDPEAPRVTRYAVAEDGALEPEDTIDFSNYGFTTWSFDTWSVAFLSPSKAYLLDSVEGTTVIWNPTTMEISGEIPAHESFHREGLSLESSPPAVRGDRLFRTFNWANYDEASYSEDFLFAVYDTKNDELLEVVEESRCPVPGNLVHEDEAGNFYFSNWAWPVGAVFLYGAPSPCVLRLNAGEERLDPEWTLAYQDVTDGHEGAMFTYLADGKAMVSAFYDERTSTEGLADPWDYVGSLNWQVWNVDLEQGTSAPLEGMPFNGGAFTPVQFDNRLFLMVPGGAEENWASQMYEVVDNQATPGIKLGGWSYQFVKLR